ncbi:GGDEF domain-containing protein [Billgrantia saliphila]|uniref:GGDEF domain-containing protein n=1 Tax=Billgrantia saliphila TaxID=1848458 RepID=UPI001E5D22B5|nr:GGDEF domain-containing protein [Halomonas saliphila]
MSDTLLKAVESDLARRRYGLRFSPIVEARFESDTSELRSRHLYLAGIVALVIYDLYLINDYAFRPESLQMAAWIRFGMMTPFGITALYFVRRGLSPAMREAVMTSTIVVGMLLSNLIFFLSKSTYSFLDTFSFGLILVMGNIVFTLRFFHAVASSLISGIIMTLFVYHYAPMEAEIKLYAFVVFISSAVFTLLANYRMEVSERQSYLLLLREQLRNSAALKDNQALAKISITDPLTGVANRRHFDAVLEHRWQEALTENTMLGMLVIDIDRFKNYNDHYGHLQGDACLRQVALEMQNYVRQEVDLVVRYGGEEFVVLLPNTSAASALHAAERIRRGIEALAIPQAGSGVITVSIGAAALRPHVTLAPAMLLTLADAALYQAKREGRNRSVLAPLRDDPLTV